MPLLPILFLLAAFVLVYLADWIRSQPKEAQRSLFAVSLVGLVAVSFLWSSRLTVINSAPYTTLDSRETARQWIAENLPAGSRIILEPYSPFVDPELYKVTAIPYATHQDLQWYRDNGFQYLIMSEGAFGRFYREPEKYPEHLAAYGELLAELQTVKIFNDGNYEVRIYSFPN